MCIIIIYTDKIGKQYITLGAHNDIVAILNNDGETDNVVTLALQALSSLITSGADQYNIVIAIFVILLLRTINIKFTTHACLK